MADQIGKERDGEIRFHFKCVCPDCDADGEVTLVAAERGTFDCPEGCGTVYCPWKGPDGQWRLKAVVVPVYGDPERDAVAFDEES